MMKLISEIQLEEFEDKSNVRLREAVRAIVLKNGEMAILYVSNKNYHKLPGGGIEQGEDLQEALDREIMEEVGTTIENIREVGKIVEYRKQHNLQQISYCFIADVKDDKGKQNFTNEEKEEGFELKWVSVEEALRLMKNDKPKDYLGTYVQVRDVDIIEYSMRNHEEIKQLSYREEDVR